MFRFRFQLVNFVILLSIRYLSRDILTLVLLDWIYNKWYIPNRLARTMEIFKHSFHIIMQLAVFAILHERGSKVLKLNISASLCLFLSLSYCFMFYSCSQILSDTIATRKDDSIKAVDIQLGQVLHLHISLIMTEPSRLHHHVPMQGPEIIINTTFWD